MSTQLGSGACAEQDERSLGYSQYADGLMRLRYDESNEDPKRNAQKESRLSAG